MIKQIREKKRDFDRYIPIVMVSAFTELTQVCMARDAGVTEFLAKPISATTIYRRICSMVENPRDFIETSSFFGPNRRRRSIGPVGDERRKEMTHLAGGRGDQRQAFPEKDK